MERDGIHELSAAYALDALDEDERRAFERHLDECDACRAEVAELQDAAAALAVAAEGPEPPPALRTRILDAARAERPAQVVPFRPRRRPRPALAVAGAAAAACIAGLAVWVGLLSHSLSQERTARAHDRSALAVLADPAAQRVPLRGATGSLVVAPSGEAALVVRRLAAAPSGKTYEAWVIRGTAAPQPAGTFAGGDTVVLLRERVPGGATVAVTVERAGGVRAPTTKPVVTATA